MTVTTRLLQRTKPALHINNELPSGRSGYNYEILWNLEHDLSCDKCGAEPETDSEPRIAFAGKFELCLCPLCTEQLLSSFIQDLARVVEKEGFVVGRWLAGREPQVTKDMEEILFSGRVLRAPKGSV